MNSEFLAPEFIPVFHSALMDKALEKQDCLVLGVVYWYERLRDGRCYASNASIARVIGSTNPKSITNSITRLEANGYIQCLYKDPNKRHRKQIICTIHRLHKEQSHPQMEQEPSTDGTTEPSTDGQRKNNNKKKSHDPLGAEIIKAFESVDVKNKNYYGHTTQRKACDFLLEHYGLEDTLKRIAILHKTNVMPYFPKINSPWDLQEKWQKLNDAVASKKVELKAKQVPIFF